MGKIHITKRYVRERIEPPTKFDPRSLRIIDPGRTGYTKLIIGCPKGEYDVEKKRCKVGTRTQAILKERK